MFHFLIVEKPNILKPAKYCIRFRFHKVPYSCLFFLLLPSSLLRVKLDFILCIPKEYTSTLPTNSAVYRNQKWISVNISHRRIRKKIILVPCWWSINIGILRMISKSRGIYYKYDEIHCGAFHIEPGVIFGTSGTRKRSS